MDDNFFDVQAGTFFTFGKPGQLSLSRILQLIGDVGDGHGLSQARISNSRNDWFHHMHTDNSRARSTGNRSRIRKGVIGAAAEIGREKNLSDLLQRYFCVVFAWHR